VRPTVHPADWPGTYFLIQERNWAFQEGIKVKKERTEVREGTERLTSREAATQTRAEERPAPAVEVRDEPGRLELMPAE
jgi:hypothetical protein